MYVVGPRPADIGHNGWISLDVHDGPNEGELRELALGSYRHFANKRTLRRSSRRI
jgi:hypothetical protein